jgi:hypothetical protein
MTGRTVCNGYIDPESVSSPYIEVQQSRRLPRIVLRISTTNPLRQLLMISCHVLQIISTHSPELVVLSTQTCSPHHLRGTGSANTIIYPQDPRDVGFISQGMAQESGQDIGILYAMKS